MSSPPVSKQTPFADKRNFRIDGLAPGNIDQPWCSRRAGADRMHQRKILGERVTTRDLHLGAVLVGECPAGRFQLGGPHIVGRCVDKIAAERHALDNAAEIFAINAFRNHKMHIALFCLAVANKLICTECKSQRSQSPIMRCVRETIGPRWQQSGQLSRPKPVNFALPGFFDPEQNAGKFPVRRGQQHRPTRLGLKVCGDDECTFSLANLPAH